MTDAGFTPDQQEYLKGFMSGVEARRAITGQPLAPVAATTTDPHHAAQDRTVAAGGKLTAEEEAKRRKHPLDRFDEIGAMAAEPRFPKGTDIYLGKFFGMFYVAPAQNACMCRLRIPGGILNAHQFRGVAAIAEDLGGGYADITTRANLQIREIGPDKPPEVLMRLAEIGLTSRGAGADNIRNITGSPTAGIDPQELIDTRPHARALHHFILHHRELYGLPRKFNIGFDGGGRVAVLEDTNDIAFSAVRVADAAGVPAGVYYRLGLGGITGHHDFARPTDVIVPPNDATRVAEAVVRVFIAEGDRTDRTKARLKYLLDRWGAARFLAAMEEFLGAPLLRVDPSAIEPRPAQDKHGHVGVHAQRQPGRNYVGVVVPRARMPAEVMRGLAAVAERFGSGTLRLTVWQNLLISDIPDAALDDALAAITALGLDWRASALRGGLVACTGNTGCKFSASDTKRHAAELVDWLEARITVDRPLNIHFTGCHNSCAQHYVADIGLLAVKVEQGDDMVEGYDLLVGGGAGAHQALGRLVRKGVTFAELPPMVLALLSAWMERRNGEEDFQAWTARQSDDELAGLTENLPLPLREGEGAVFRPPPRFRPAMNAVAPPIPLIPENAPFSPEQRAWLNGFLAGLYGGATQPMSAAPPPSPEPAEDFPWHDPVLELPERLALAEGRPLPQLLMAAMGQLDCGQCGYMCDTYAAALAEGRESSISLCVPGAKPTQLALKRLMAEAPTRPAAPVAKAPAVPAGRDVRVLAAEPLTGPGSSKDVRHVVVDLSDSGLTYTPGDSLSIAVPNDPALVAATLAALGTRDEAVRAALTNELDIARPLDRTLDLLAGAAVHSRHAAALRALSDGETGAEPADADLLDLLEAFPSARPPLADLLRSLPPLRPRLYSIASSQRVTPREVHLCVAVVRDTHRGRLRHGVASGFLADRTIGHGTIRGFIQTSHFRLPADARTHIVMCGPGTGVAPFRAFLQERAVLGIKGRAWLLFGERQRAHDFLYEAELKTWLADGTLSRLDVAFSRDQASKDYVQHRMAENAADLWRWLQDGAHFYVCGDATRMARDVDAALRRIAMTEGKLDEGQARDWIVALARQGRYQRDIY